MPDATTRLARARLPARLAGPRTRVALALAALLLVAVAWGVHRFVGWDTVASTARRIPASAWASFAALLALSYAARAARLWRLLHDIDPRVQVTRATATFFVHNALATLLPARLGEAAMPLLARRWLGLDWAATVGALAWWRVSDLAVVAAIALALLATGAGVLAPLYGVALGACAVPLLLFALRGPLATRAARSSSRPAQLAVRVLAGMPARVTALLADLALAVLVWTCKLTAFTKLLLAGLAVPGILTAGLPPPHATLVAAAALAADAAGALPLPTLAGIGPFEAGIVLGLGALHVDAPAALALGVTLHGAVLGSIVVTGVLALASGIALARSRAG